jgi:hypothetical protein
MTSWLAVLYVVLLPLGRAGLPLNAQWGDFVLPLLALSVAGGRPSRWRALPDRPLAAYLLVTLVSAGLSSEPFLGFTQLFKQTSVVLIFLVFRQLLDEPPMLRRLIAAFSASVAAVTLLSILVLFFNAPAGIPAAWVGASDVLPFFGLVKRLRGTFITPEMLGNALVVAFVLALALRVSSTPRSRGVWTTIAAILVAGEFLTFSHSVAGFAVATAIFTTGTVGSRAGRVALWSAALVVVAAVNAASFVEPGPLSNDYGVGPVSYEVMGVKIEGELNHYAALKQVAWAAFLDHPFKGIGPGRFPTETERGFHDGRLNARYRSKVAQCDLLGRLAETGFFGGLSLVVVWMAWLRRGATAQNRSALNRAAFAAVAGLLVNSLNADVMNFRFLWLAVAWMEAPGKDDAAPRAH